MIQAVKQNSKPKRKRLRTDRAESPVRSVPTPDRVLPSKVGQTQQRNLAQLRVVREHIEELILLSDRRLCQEFVGGLTTAEKARYKAESQRLVAKVRQVIGTARSEAPAKVLDRVANRPSSEYSQNTPVQIQMSAALVRILEAFSKAGKRPGRLIERALWNDRDIQNAALLLRIKRPDAVRQHSQP